MNAPLLGTTSDSKAGITSTKMNAVRLGNVLGSQGSVGPLFQQQIQRGGPVTVTHAEASRYFLMLSETVELIMAAAALDDSGSIFIPKMCEPVICGRGAATIERRAALPRDWSEV